MNRNGNPHRIVKLRVRGWNVDHIHRTAYLMVQGAFVKVTAIDPETGLEASIVGPSNASQAMLAEQARRKLEYVARKKG